MSKEDWDHLSDIELRNYIKENEEDLQLDGWAFRDLQQAKQEEARRQAAGETNKAEWWITPYDCEGNIAFGPFQSLEDAIAWGRTRDYSVFEEDGQHYLGEQRGRWPHYSYEIENDVRAFIEESWKINGR